MEYKKREITKAERKRNRIEIRGFLVKKLSDFACSFKERLDNEITVKSISSEEKEKTEFVIEMTSFEMECVSKAMNDYLRKCDVRKAFIRLIKRKRWYPYRGLEEVKIKLKEEVPSEREAGNKNANEASNEISNKMLGLPIIEYEVVIDLTDSNKKKIEEEVLKCLHHCFSFSLMILQQRKAFLSTKLNFCVVCERLLCNFHGIKFNLPSNLHKSNSPSVFQEENKTCKIIVNLSKDTKECDIDKMVC